MKIFLNSIMFVATCGFGFVTHTPSFAQAGDHELDAKVIDQALRLDRLGYPNDAETLLQAAITRGSIAALNAYVLLRAGWLYGRNGCSDQEWLALAERAITAGSVQAAISYAHCLQFELKQPAKALSLLEEWSIRGYGKASWTLSQHYLFVQSQAALRGPPDPSYAVKACEYAQLAHTQGEDRALPYLGRCHIDNLLDQNDAAAGFAYVLASAYLKATNSAPWAESYLSKVEATLDENTKRKGIEHLRKLANARNWPIETRPYELRLQPPEVDHSSEFLASELSKGSVWRQLFVEESFRQLAAQYLASFSSAIAASVEPRQNQNLEILNERIADAVKLLAATRARSASELPSIEAEYRKKFSVRQMDLLLMSYRSAQGENFRKLVGAYINVESDFIHRYGACDSKRNKAAAQVDRDPITYSPRSLVLINANNTLADLYSRLDSRHQQFFYSMVALKGIRCSPGFQGRALDEWADRLMNDPPTLETMRNLGSPRTREAHRKSSIINDELISFDFHLWIDRMERASANPDNVAAISQFREVVKEVIEVARGRMR